MAPDQDKMQLAPRGLGIAAAVLVMLVIGTAPARAEPEFTSWSPPVPTVGGGCPIESRDGNHLYTAANSEGTLDIYVYRRYGRNEDFDERTRLGPPVSLDDANDFCPTPLTGDWLMFVSTRGGNGACGNADIFLARYRVQPPQSMTDARRLACHPDGPNTGGAEFSPSLITTPEGTFLFYSSDVGGDQDIYRSEMAPDGSFGPGVPVAELNTQSHDQQPNVSRDGLAIVFASSRDSGGAVMDVFTATRDSTAADWSAPVNLSVALAFPTMAQSETRPSLSWDLKRLYYGANGLVWTSERAPAAQKPQ